MNVAHKAVQGRGLLLLGGDLLQQGVSLGHGLLEKLQPLGGPLLDGRLRPRRPLQLLLQAANLPVDQVEAALQGGASLSELRVEVRLEEAPNGGRPAVRQLPVDEEGGVEGQRCESHGHGDEEEQNGFPNQRTEAEGEATNCGGGRSAEY